jgi:hypothetical protein
MTYFNVPEIAFKVWGRNRCKIVNRVQLAEDRVK